MEVTNEINEIASKIAELYRSGIVNSNSVATGSLQSFTWTAKFSGMYFEIEFTVPKYWKYAPENSRKGGKMPPIDAIEQWIKVKNLPVPTTKKGIPQYRSAAFCIARKIKEVGWKKQPLKLLQNAMNTAENTGLVDQLCNLIAEQIYNEDLKETIDNI